MFKQYKLQDSSCSRHRAWHVICSLSITLAVDEVLNTQVWAHWCMTHTGRRICVDLMTIILPSNCINGQSKSFVTLEAPTWNSENGLTTQKLEVFTADWQHVRSWPYCNYSTWSTTTMQWYYDNAMMHSEFNSYFGITLIANIIRWVNHFSIGANNCRELMNIIIRADVIRMDKWVRVLNYSIEIFQHCHHFHVLQQCRERK